MEDMEDFGNFGFKMEPRDNVLSDFQIGYLFDGPSELDDLDQVSFERFSLAPYTFLTLGVPILLTVGDLPVAVLLPNDPALLAKEHLYPISLADTLSKFSTLIERLGRSWDIFLVEGLAAITTPLTFHQLADPVPEEVIEELNEQVEEMKEIEQAGGRPHYVPLEVAHASLKFFDADRKFRTKDDLTFALLMVLHEQGYAAEKFLETLGISAVEAKHLLGMDETSYEKEDPALEARLKTLFDPEFSKKLADNEARRKTQHQTIKELQAFFKKCGWKDGEPLNELMWDGSLDQLLALQNNLSKDLFLHLASLYNRSDLAEALEN